MSVVKNWGAIWRIMSLTIPRRAGASASQIARATTTVSGVGNGCDETSAKPAFSS